MGDCGSGVIWVLYFVFFYIVGVFNFLYVILICGFIILIY